MRGANKYKIFDRMLEGVQVVDPEGGYVYVNDAVAIHARRTKEELLGSSMEKEYPGIERREVFATMQRCHVEQTSQDFVTEFEFPDGTKGYFKLRMEPVEEGVLIMSFDITDFKRKNVELENVLSESINETNRQKKTIENQRASILTISNMHKAILDNTTDGIILIDPDHKVLCYNKEIQDELFKYFKKNIEVGDDYRDYVIDSHQALYLTSFDRSLSGETIVVESETVAGDVAIWFQYKVNPVYDDAGTILGVTLTATNIDGRKRKEIALLQSEMKVKEQANKIISSEKYFRTLIETSSDAVVLLSADGAVLYQTPSTERICGYSLQEMQSIYGGDLIHPDDRADDRKTFRELISTPGSVLHKKHRFRHKNGNYIWIEGSYRNLLHDDNLKAIVYNYTDVTARVQAELQLKERIKELSTIYNINRILQDENQHLDDLFQKIVKLLPTGWQYPDICEARIVFGGVDYHTPNYVSSAFLQSASINTMDGRTGFIEVVYTREMPDIDEGPFLKEERELINTLATTIEVYLNKKANQDALSKSEANLKSIFDTTHVSYILLDECFRVITFNQYFAKGYEEQTGIELKIGVSFIELTMPDKREMIKSVLQNVLQNSRPIEYETIYTNRDTEKYFNVEVTPVISNGKVIGLCIAGVDVTNRKNIEIERQKMMTDLIQRNRDLEQFSHIVSHNVRGPLSTILGLNNMLADQQPEVDREFIQEGIRASSEKLDSVIKDLNEILQTRRELSELKVKVDLQQIVDDIKGGIMLLIRDKNVIIDCDFSAVRALLTVRSYINSIFYNLITNSIKFAQPGASPVIKIWSGHENGRIIISFRDNGIGIDLTRYSNRVFTLYSRFHHSVEGRGLGLFMTKTQVEVLNGTIEMESEPGVGTLVKISFPE